MGEKRIHNTERLGKPWPIATIEAVWKEGIPRERNVKTSTLEIKRDVCGLVMHRAEFGNRGSEFGWEIDHIKPVSEGGGDELENLQPLNWKNNSDKADKYPWYCGY